MKAAAITTYWVLKSLWATDGGQTTETIIFPILKYKDLRCWFNSTAFSLRILLTFGANPGSWRSQQDSIQRSWLLLVIRYIHKMKFMYVINVRLLLLQKLLFQLKLLFQQKPLYILLEASIYLSIYLFIYLSIYLSSSKIWPLPDFPFQ